jgi:hypothetical protein
MPCILADRLVCITPSLNLSLQAILGPNAHKMSGQIIEAQEGRAISVVDGALGSDATPPVITEISATGKRGIPVLIAPLQSQQRHTRARGATAQEMSTGFQGFLLLEKNDDDDPRKKWFKKMSGWLMVLANLVVSVTYQAGLNPPGGFWQDNSDGHHAGEPVLRDVHCRDTYCFTTSTRRRS